MRYQLTPIHCRPWTLNALSFKLIESHYENNYGGALRRLNAITEKLESLDWANTPGYVINGLKREELVALNSTLLHELYFASMGGDGQATEAMSAVLARDFGSVLRWKDEFVAMGNALAGGSGWVVLTYLPRDRRLINQYAVRAQPGRGGRHPDPRARHVRACLPHGLWREREGVRRHLHAQPRLEGALHALRGRGEGRRLRGRWSSRNSAICRPSASRK